MPVVMVPFERIGIDIVGPLTPSTHRHKYILMVIDYTSHYPQAMPLQNMRADTVAQELAGLFTWVGFPKQVVTEQRMAFMSETLKSM